MKSDNILVIVAIIAVAISFVGTAIIYNSINTFENLLTGFATETGFVNVTISSGASINITTANNVGGSETLDWGSGTVSDPSAATLVSNGTVTGGSWSSIGSGFIIENIGNENVTLNISSDKTAATLFDGTDPSFQYNVTNSEANSCTFFGGVESIYTDFTTSAATGGVCSIFEYIAARDTIRIDLLLRIPSDTTPTPKNASIILTYSGA